MKLDKRLTRFVHSLISCKNDTRKALIHIFLSCESSVFAENCIYFVYKYNISVFTWHALTDQRTNGDNIIVWSSVLCTNGDNIIWSSVLCINIICIYYICV